MNKKTKRLFGFGIALGGALVLSSCNSFCSDTDVSNFLFINDPINTRFFDSVAHGEDYVLSTFKSQKNFDPELSANFSTKNLKVEVFNDDTNKLELKDYDPELLFEPIVDGNDHLFKLNPTNVVAIDSTTANKENVRSNITYTFGLNDFTKNVINTAKANGILTPSFDYFKELDAKYLEKMEKEAKNYEWLSGMSLKTLTFNQIYGYSYENLVEFNKDNSNKKLLNSMLEGDKDGDKISTTNPGRNNSFLVRLGHIKFANAENPKDHFATIASWTNELINEKRIDNTDIPSISFNAIYKQTLNQKAQGFRTCITVNDGFYGHIGNDPLNDTILIEGKGENFYEGWGQAFSKHGFLEGLFVYPIATLVENLSHALGMNGVGQILAVLITTAIVRLLFMLVTLPSTLSQQKMTFIQPEIAKLQQKYPNSNTNQYERQKMAQAQMALYKKYKIHPFSSMLVIFIQFPIFISVWNALNGSASLSSDAVLGLRLSDTISTVLFNFQGWPSNPGWWTALTLILLMSAGQIFAMFIPQWLNKKRTKNVTKVGVNPALDKQNKTMKITSWVMTIMIIFMGFSLPSAMGVYWLAGAIFSIIQSVIMHLVFVKKQKKGQI